MIIVKPSALAKKALGLIIQRVEEKGVRLVSIKTSLLDVHSIEKKLLEEKEEKNKQELINAKKNSLCVNNNPRKICGKCWTRFEERI